MTKTTGWARFRKVEGLLILIVGLAILTSLAIAWALNELVVEPREKACEELGGVLYRSLCLDPEVVINP